MAEIDNNIAERAIRSIAIGRKNWLFAGSKAGGERAAAIYSVIETAKLNGVPNVLRPGVHRDGGAGMAGEDRCKDALYHAGQSMGEWLLRKLQRIAA